MRPSRTLLAAIGAAALLGLPGAAWFVTGSRAASQEADRIRREALEATQGEADRLAQRLAVRLEALRQSESRRAHTDYRPPGRHPQDPDCAPPFPSPLAEGPADPLVWAHFQIDGVGRLTIPTLAGTPVRPRDDDDRLQQAILDQLECAAPEQLLATGKHDAEGGIDPGVVFAVGPLGWRTIRVGDEPALVALREVSTPTETLHQGFVVRTAALEALLDDAQAAVRVGPAERLGEARVPIEGDPWRVAIDATDPLAAATREGRLVRRRFLAGFAIGLAAAAVGGAMLVAMVHQSERLARERARFAAAAAHELRTPLASLRLYGEMLADAGHDTERRRRYAGHIAGEAARLGRVVSNLLGLARLESGRLELDCRPDDLGRVVRESVERLRPTLEAAGEHVELTVGDAIPRVRLDPDAIHQILQNLLDNALRHGGSGGSAPITVRVAGSAAGVELSVTDAGRGVPRTARRRLFRPFAIRPTPGGTGLGLGLSLVNALARAQDAQAAYTAAAGGGSCFKVRFPPLRGQVSHSNIVATSETRRSWDDVEM